MVELNLIVVIADTLRRDHIGAYGNDGIRTPHLDHFARQSALFDQHLISNFPTMPARADFLTGAFTFARMGWEPLPATVITLVDVLNSAGYLTTGIVDTPFYVRNGYGYDRGFDDFYWIRGQGDNLRPVERLDARRGWRGESDRFAPVTMSAAEAWLENHYKDRFFLLVDTWDPHEPWDPPAHYTEMYAANYDGRAVEYPCYGDWKTAGMTEEAVGLAHAAYCGEVTMTDRAIGGLLEKIDLLGLTENTIVVFLSDHGFYFGEHGYFGKAAMADRPLTPEDGLSPEDFWEIPDKLWGWSPLYQELTRVPLMIRAPKIAPRRLAALTTLPDIAPTILDMLGLEIPIVMNGSSFRPALMGEASEHRQFVVSSWPLNYSAGGISLAVDSTPRAIEGYMPMTVTSQSTSVIIGGPDDMPELYDLTQDPGETTNVWPDREPEGKRLLENALEFLAECGADDDVLDARRTIIEMARDA